MHRSGAGRGAQPSFDPSDPAPNVTAPDEPASAFAGHIGYRADIDGLRTVAVLSVVLFHLDPRWAPGGFVGVDIFFVISGFLITGIVQREIVDGRFSILRFYERRARRIFPALFAMLACTLIAGFFIFMPDELRDLGASIVATTTFSSNILFWLQTDYFSGPVEFKPLLHTWSLAVEEQYYLLVPPLMYVLHRWSPRFVKPAFAGLFVLSFVASCVWVFIDPSGNYYLPHTRAWELFTGSLIAMNMVPRIRSDTVGNLASVVGLFLLIGPIFWLSADSVFPAWNALAPCIGAAMLIHSGNGRVTIGGRLLGLKPMAAFGLISYSLYLVHWPLISFTRYQLLREPSVIEKLTLCAAMIVLATLSWRYVETPFRDRKRVTRRTIFVLGATATALAAASGAAVFLLKGIPQRFGEMSALAQTNDAQIEESRGCFLKGGWQDWKGDRCFLTRARGGPVTLLWGDSHANQFVPVLRRDHAGIDGSLLYYASAGCPPILDVDIPKRPDCRANNRHALEIIRQYDVRKVVLVGYWERIFHDNRLVPADMRETMRVLHSMGVKIAMIGDNPDYPLANPDFLGMRLARRDNPKAPYYTTIRNDRGFNPSLHAAARPDVFFDPMEKLCRGNECLIYADGEILMSDNAHLSTQGARLVLNQMRGKGIFDSDEQAPGR